jgi:hypothetical protein
MATVVKTTFQFKRGTAAKWIELNLTLAAGEPGFEIDTGRLKIGDGKRAWLDLPYLGEGGVVNAATHYDFPETGAADVIYKAAEEKLLYQWNSNSNAYELLGMGGEGGGAIVDTELSDSSMNAIANSAVTKALKDLEAKIPEVLSYSFNEGLRVEVVDGIQVVNLDVDYIRQLIPEIDLSDYATKAELAGLATEEFVLQKISEIEIPTVDVDLSNYYTKEEVEALIPSMEGFATTEYVNSQTAEITNLLETNYITIEQGVTKEALADEVREVIGSEVENIVEEKLAEGVAVNKIEYGTF